MGFKKYQMSNFAYGETSIQVLNNKLDHKFSSFKLALQVILCGFSTGIKYVISFILTSE